MTSAISSHPPELADPSHGSLRPLAAEAVEFFSALEGIRQYIEGAVLFEEGQPSAGLFLLLSGRVKLSVNSRRGSQFLFEVAGAGEMLGLSACVSSKPFELTARTLTPCEAIFVPREAFLSFLRERPQACVAMVKLLCNDLDAAYERIRHLRRR